MKRRSNMLKPMPADNLKYYSRKHSPNRIMLKTRVTEFSFFFWEIFPVCSRLAFFLILSSQDDSILSLFSILSKPTVHFLEEFFFLRQQPIARHSGDRTNIVCIWWIKLSVYSDFPLLKIVYCPHKSFTASEFIKFVYSILRSCFPFVYIPSLSLPLLSFHLLRFHPPSFPVLPILFILSCSLALRLLSFLSSFLPFPNTILV